VNQDITETQGLGMLKPMLLVLCNPSLRAIALTLFLSSAALSSVAPYQAIIAIREIGLGESAYGALLLLTAAISVVFSIIAGIMADRNRVRRPFVLFSLASGCFGQLLIFTFPVPLVFVLSGLFLIPPMLTVYSQLFAAAKAVADHELEKSADQAIAAIRSILALSWVTVPPIISLALAFGMPIGGSYAVAAAICFTAFSLVVLLKLNLQPALVPQSPVKESVSILSGLAELSRIFIVVRVMTLGLILGCQFLFMTIYGLLIVSTDGGSDVDVGVFQGVLALLEIPFIMIASALLARMTKSDLIVIGALVFGFFAILLGNSQDIRIIYLLLIPGAFGNAVIVSISIGYLQDLITHKPGSASSLITVSNFLGVTCSSLTFAALSSIFSYQDISVVAGVIGVAGSFLLFYLDRTDIAVLKRAG
jgi:MFS transporter, SET family, sugar efflux transporter